MGVSGSGKTTLGSMLAEKLNTDFFDGDDFHPKENIAKMSNGIPLTDDDRIGWLDRINEKGVELIQNNKSGVFACSALKESYRKRLSNTLEKEILFVYPKGSQEVIQRRMDARKDHFMPSNLLDSQFSILEEPKNAIEIDLTKTPEQMLEDTIKKMALSEFGLVGLGVMGKSLARNLANNGTKLSLFNRYVKGSEEGIANKFINSFEELSDAQGFEDLEDFVESMQTPRKIFLMIKAGKETDEFIEKIKPFLNAEDVLIDGGNSHFKDTKRRIEYLEKEGIYFVGTGVSGGEEGALKGPSIMPSGNFDAYKTIEPFLKKIAAKDKKGLDCCTYIGPEGSGHFIKMVHNGIEYAEMQLIAEVYALLRYSNQMSPDEISEVFKEWNQGELKSYLLEISSEILTKKEGDNCLLDMILDQAGNKGTGNWTTVTATEMGMPATMITSALFARYVSSVREKYGNLSLITEQSFIKLEIETVKNAYSLARIINHQQGFTLIKIASEEYRWNLNLSEISRIWTNGCIIRSTLMEEISAVFKHNSDIFDDLSIFENVNKFRSALKTFCVSSLMAELPIPTMLAANDFVNSLNGEIKTANIIQAQRDFFGAHTYQRTDAERGKFFHTNW
ncbi:NADP-dependent phosphogluconate dehydrogenase [Lacihabitans sp. LS3-19]|nr:NADP-dependent phosphogluconate dehydrogenase [Lacihabitans sp. LS3-19]